ncbi:DUF2637 domain-containing protein [Streptantibioticus ferralitis]|uniref:DUF2637 domain-containing protein n=1 Tax=Streptantibioticus ferralitis TaxID=236510 RepID=A0ABT5ZAS7_9ACTN|nr:DUF2637 domain-containing protein [Streptantibioticus ferralitis]MDF2260946.1 DUF2637 domain-containing protein [Streptantibioticus ferralitis]
MEEIEAVQAPSGSEETASGAGAWELPQLSRFEWVVLGAIVLGALGVGALGLYSSFDAVSRYMQSRGFSHPWIVPVAIDIAIPVFGLAYLLLVRLKMPLWWVRWVPYGLTGITIYLNAQTSASVEAKVAHGVLPSLWVAATEIAAHAYRVRIGAASGELVDSIPLSRWLLALPSTAAMYRRMRLWDIRSYTVALGLEEQRILAMTALRKEYGRGWRRKAPLDLRMYLLLGKLTADMVRDGTRPTPHPVPTTGGVSVEQLDAIPASIPAQRELELPEEQTALPVGIRRAEMPPEGDAPQPMTALVVSSTVLPEPPSLETADEREQREEAEAAQRRDDNYEKAIEIVMEYLREGRPVPAAQKLAERAPFGARTMQRHVSRMKKEGIIPEAADKR